VFWGRKREWSPRENPPNGDFGGFSHGDLSPCLPCENTKKSPFGGFSPGAFSPFHPENTLIRHGTNQPAYLFLPELDNNKYERPTTILVTVIF